jgi:ABC-type nitrate/sulfonate/bicarbonate transport system substrate-binding protein
MHRVPEIKTNALTAQASRNREDTMKGLRPTTLCAAGFFAASLIALPARAESEKASIALPALTVTFMPVYIAKDLGMWDKLGLDVTLHDITGMGSTNAMLAGSVDFAVQSGPSLIRGNTRGQKMVGVALMANGVAFELDMTKEAAGKVTMAAPLAERAKLLKGKTISVDSPKTVVEGFLRYVAAKGGIDPDRDIKMTFMQPPAAIASLVGGSSDGAVLNFPWTVGAQRQGAVLVASGLSDVPELLPTIATSTTTRPDFCKEHRSTCVKLVRGYVQSHALILDHPDKALEVAKKRMPKANPEDIAKSLAALAKSTPRQPSFEEKSFLNAQQLMLVGGMIKKDEMVSSFKGMFNNEFVDLATKPGS